ncbi:MAG: hypothetical protein KF841_13760 [Phycisphaerae bacterium]|nr:hypothetical protein [Phycisphaerae bacterium]
MMHKRLFTLLSFFTLAAGVGMSADNGCQGPDFSSLAGLWSIERGSLEAKFTFTINNGGEVTQNSSGGELQPLDPADFPEQLADLVAQWNEGLDDLNAAVDDAMPDRVIVTFPGSFQMRIANAEDPLKNGTGLINENAQYGFVAILGGGGNGSQQGGGGVLDVSSIEGSFNVPARTTAGKVVRRLIVGLIGSNDSSLSFVAELTVNYTGAWIDEVPLDNSNGNSNSNDNLNANDNANDNS